jgi:hypothetical protein
MMIVIIVVRNPRALTYFQRDPGHMVAIQLRMTMKEVEIGARERTVRQIVRCPSYCFFQFLNTSQGLATDTGTRDHY